MSRIVDQFDPATETSTTFNAGFSNGTGRIVIYNQSPNNLTISWDAFSAYCPAWSACLYCITSSTVNLNWAIQTTLVNASLPPISQVTVEAFNADEPIMGTYPAALNHQTSIGNSVSTTVTSTSAISNTGNAPLSNWLAVLPNDALANTFTGDTSGNLTIKSDNAGVLTTLLQLIAGASPAVKIAAAAMLTEVLGNMKVDGTFESVGNATHDGTLAVTGVSTLTGLLTANGGVLLPNAGQLQGKDNAGTVYNLVGTDASNNVNIGTMEAAGTGRTRIVDSHGNIIASFIDANSIDTNVDGANSSLSVGLVYFSIGQMKAINKGSISASGTVNHGLSGTPTNVLLCPSVSGSTWTFQASTFTSTQFTATLNSALNTNWTAYR